MTRNIKRAVEDIKSAYLSHVPVAWLVTPDKEVADEIVTSFIVEHMGALTKPNASMPKHPGDLIRFLSADPGAGPGVYFQWYSPVKTNNENASSGLSDLSIRLERFINGFYRFETEKDGREAEKGGAEKSIAIVASDTTPDLGWMNSYIETVYVSALEDDEIKNLLQEFISQNGISVSPNLFDQLAINLRGFSRRRISSILSKCLIAEYFDNDETEKILREIRLMKRQMLDGFAGLKWIDVNDDDPEAAGLDEASKWLEERKQIFSDPRKSIMQGFDIPKGIILTGVPGTGKSLMAKQTARILGLPLVAMDLGDLQEGVVGKSEEHMAKALRMIDAISPCVLWIDEIEKAFSGAESGHSDGGVMRRMFGKFLTWMQEKKSYCFVLATSNDITKLPPELFRSQRFDEKYYTFMPSAKECAQMFVANIKQHNKRIVDSKGFKVKIFDSSVFEDEAYWLDFLNRICTCNVNSDGVAVEESVQLNNSGKWLSGYLPQKKLFTGADIATFVNNLKFKILTQREKQGSPNFKYSGPIKKTEVDAFITPVLGGFIPYGQSNLKDIAKCFRTLSHNRFKSASVPSDDKAIVRFSDYDEVKQRMKYVPTRFAGPDSKYNRTLYMCVVGTINSLAESNQQPAETGGTQAVH